MGLISRTDFTRGWVSSADAVQASADALLRMDNCVLDERGAVTLRKGSSKINSVALADTDIHSLYTATLSGTRYRMAGAASAVYANGTSISSGLNGSGDIAFGSYLDQILFARGTSKKKYDGTTVRNWGIAAPGAAPTVAAVAADTKTFVSFTTGEAGTFTFNDDTTGRTFAAGFDGTANGATILNPAATGVGRITKLFGSAQDFTVYDGAGTGTDDDLIEMYVYVANVLYAQTLWLQFDVSAGDFQTDYYHAVVQFLQPQDPDQPENPNVVPLQTAAFTRIQIRRGDMLRFGGASGKNWSTVRAVRLTANSSETSTTAQWQFDELRIVGSATRPITGTATYKIVAVNNSGTYTAKSAPSAVSAAIELRAQATDVTLAATPVNNLDSQVNELWLYRLDDQLDDYYRVATKTGGPFSGAQTIRDTTSSADALVTNLKIEANNTTPPDTIVGICGPHYDRILCLTAVYLYASQPRNLDSFDATHVIRVGDASETALWAVKVREEVYVGTTKDIYRIEGDWTVRADLLINVVKRPLGLSQPPISSAVTVNGDTIIYLASDGWRALGGPAPLTAGDVDLLYRGYTRHGVSPVNLSTGRFKVAVAGGVISAITPEGASTTSSTVLHRFVPALQRWYRHTYSATWRALYREPDGTLIASDSSGFVWTLDTGTQDGGADLAVVLWTPVSDNGQPLQRKRGGDVRMRLNTGGATATIGVHLDSASSAGLNVTASSSGVGVVNDSLVDLALAVQYQLRLTGSFSTFALYDYAVGYAECPVPMQGRTPDTDAGHPGPKALSGLRLRVCTLGATRAITPIVDGVALDAVDIATDTDDPDDVLIPFSAIEAATDVAFSVDGPIELYSWTPVVEHALPPPRRLYDSGPVDLGSRAAWIPSLEIKAKLGAALTVTPYIDDVAQAAQTLTPSSSAITTFTVALSRPVRGRQPRVVLSSTSSFYLYWVEWNYRTTGTASDLKRARVKAA